ncbi:MAG: hypothetical protein AB9891_13645 [Anaerolineaceae bacterium]
MDILSNPENQKRLVVLLPETLVGDIELARRIYWLGNKNHYAILYLTMVDDFESTLTISRHMATMRALTSDNSLSVDSILTETRTWLKTLKDEIKPGDILVCHAEQSAKRGLFKTISLFDFLNESFQNQIITLSGFYHPQAAQINKWLHGLIYWFGCLVLLAAFFAAGIQIENLSQGLVRNIMGIIGVAVEIGAVVAWTKIASR